MIESDKNDKLGTVDIAYRRQVQGPQQNSKDDNKLIKSECISRTHWRYSSKVSGLGLFSEKTSAGQ